MVDTPLKKQNRQNTYFRACLHEGGGPQVGEVTWGGLPHLTCKRDHIKMRDYMDRRVTPPKRVTSPTWGTPISCKQALRDYSKLTVNSFVMENVTEAQVSNLFKNLDTNKSSIDIPNKLIKMAAEHYLSAPFTQIYNQSIETGIVPNILNVSQFTPVYKSGDATDPANYRPISALSSFSKVFEKLIYNQLYNFLEKCSILYKYQFGFRKGYSTEQAILETTDSLKKAGYG